MKLKHEKVTTFNVDYSDFQDFVRDIYGGDFDFVADHEAHNNSCYSFSAPNSNVDFDGKYEESIRNGKFHNVPVDAVFNVLYKDGHIEEGDYTVEVYW